MQLELAVVLHPTVIPPWYPLTQLDEYFFLAFYVIPTIGFALIWLRPVTFRHWQRQDAGLTRSL